jgi:hypothetical protein
MTEDEKVKHGAQAKEAQFVLGILDPVLLGMREDVIAKLKNFVRQGNHSESKLLAAATELCTLDDIRNRLEQRIGSGE